MRLTVLLLFLCWCCALRAQSTWPQFRGVRASGLDTNRAAPISWDVAQGQNIGWRTGIPGLAHSSPIIWKDRIYLATADRPGKADLKVGLYGNIDSANDQQIHQWRVLALDSGTGKIVWNKVIHEGIPKVKRHTKATHCNSTPATDGKVIVAIFGSEGLFCLDMEGNLRWKKDLGPMDSGYFQARSAQWGFASSPVIHGDAVIVQCDVQTNSFIAAFALSDGSERWRTARKDVPTWSTPTVVAFGEHQQILVNGWHETAGYNLVTGKKIWELNGGGDIPVPTPIFDEKLAYFTSAHGRFRPISAIRLEAQGNITPAEVGATNGAIAWVHPRQGNYMQTPILIDDRLYAGYDNGVVSCFEASTGKTHFSQRIGSGAEGFTASPVSDGRSIYFPSEQGNVYVLAATTNLQILATNSIAETCLATPALLDGTLYFRGRENLTAVKK